MKRRKTNKGAPLKTKYSSHKLRPDTLVFKIQKLFQSQPNKTYNARQVKQRIGVTNSIDAVNEALIKLDDKGIIDYNRNGKYHLNHKFKENKTVLKPERPKGFIGKVDMTKSGNAYVIIPEREMDVFVRSTETNGAMDGDKVRVIVKPRRGRKPEGKIVKVIERSATKVMGIFRIYQKNGVVYNLNTRQSVDVYIHPDNYDNAEDGDVVIANITSWGTNQNKGIWGEIISIHSDNTENDIAMKSILVEHGFDLEFSDEVIEEVRQISGEITEKDLSNRRDMRGITTFTIDPLTAKDFDDALSIEYKEDNTIEVGIHIADVTHYVRPKTALDKEAYKRSTSVYLVDRVLPMLPERLSNELCSLRPEEEKLSFSAIFTFNKSKNIIREWFGKTIIYSDKRFTYEEAQEILENKEGLFSKELSDLNMFAHHLRKEKFKHGAIDFESEEVVFRLDEDAVPVEVHVKERKDAHKLVEEFMLLANKKVAKFISKKSKAGEIPFVYRVHDMPNQEKLKEFSLFAKEMGFTMKVDTPNQVVKSINDLVKASHLI